jgi:hypothetical protein
MADETKAIVENGNVGPPKTAKQLEKEAKKQAKLDKLKQKLEKQQNAAPKKENEVRVTQCYNICSILIVLLEKRKKERSERSGSLRCTDASRSEEGCEKSASRRVQSGLRGSRVVSVVGAAGIL